MIPNEYPSLNYDLGDTADMLRDTVRSFTSDHIAPIADEIDKSNVFPRHLWPKMGELGLLGIRHQPAEYASLAHLDASMFLFTFVVALVASLIAGILPAWRACVLAPAPQLKAA